jgi:hypothetical protein
MSDTQNNKPRDTENKVDAVDPRSAGGPFQPQYLIEFNQREKTRFFWSLAATGLVIILAALAILRTKFTL